MNGAQPRAQGKLDPAAPEAVDRLCSGLRTGLLAKLPNSERFIVELLVREALMNAVEHGPGPSRPGAIQYEIQSVPGGIAICVDDGGSGFDWLAWREDDYPLLSESGHGLKIFRRYADRVRFCGNGSRVELVRIFPQGDLRYEL